MAGLGSATAAIRIGLVADLVQLLSMAAQVSAQVRASAG
jgi:hypothetical protein